jgi:hypothetical protein
MPKLIGNTLTESRQGSQSCSIPPTSFTNRSRDKSHQWAKGNTNPAPMYLHHTSVSPRDLRNSITSHIINRLHHRTTNSSNHLTNPHRNSMQLIPRALSPATCISHHGLPITEPHLHQNTMETSTPTDSLCATNMPQPRLEGKK